jgi:hypothetical protein
MPATDRPPLSILVATVQGWHEMRGCLERLLPQAEATGAEVIVADAMGVPYPITHPNLRVVFIKGKSVFDLRAAAVGKARGEIVAFTEDHCRVAPDWCAQIIAAHRAHPEAALIGGRVVNGSPHKLIDWANFLLTFSPFLKPSTTPRGSRVPPPANVSYKRDRLPDHPATGELEIALPERLQAEGAVVMVDEIEMTHIQTHGFVSTFAHHYDNGRSTAGLALLGAPPTARRRRIGAALRAFPRLLWVTVRNTMRRGVVPGRARLSLPLVTIVIGSHTVGEIAGALRGPGNSPQRLS